MWLFTGQGSHWRTMGQTMYQHSTAFADTLDRCFSACSEMLTPSLREAMFNPIRRNWTIWPGAAGDCRV
nr:Acyl transferase domain [Klebsiella pneumoniae]